MSGSALKPEIGKQDNQLQNGAHQHAFLRSNIEDSTFHHPSWRMVPLSLQRGKRMACFSSYSFCSLVFYAEGKVPHVTIIPILWHTAFYFPPPARKDRAVNSMEIKDFIILWTYSQWRQALVVIPPLSPERETFCKLSFSATFPFYRKTFGILP